MQRNVTQLNLICHIKSLHENQHTFYLEKKKIKVCLKLICHILTEIVHHMGFAVAKTRCCAVNDKCCVADDAALSLAHAGSRENQLGFPFWTRPHANGALAQIDVPRVKDDQRGRGVEEGTIVPGCGTARACLNSFGASALVAVALG